ncbi:hypothetical protein Y1Q_0007977 [Alligator mississippiensis]|uniref:Uncharacterized protein n=1 Tax=Alligator mississippiensis TaxID=8496 RepID=A0A151NF21_ALLMI|nr:hypothetical protein Y1Q_0007977 [Alligator mississippiensis]
MRGGLGLEILLRACSTEKQSVLTESGPAPVKKYVYYFSTKLQIVSVMRKLASKVTEACSNKINYLENQLNKLFGSTPCQIGLTSPS